VARCRAAGAVLLQAPRRVWRIAGCALRSTAGADEVLRRDA
jgi:hypothetical protein